MTAGPKGRRSGEAAIPDSTTISDTPDAKPVAVLAHAARVLPAVTVDTYNEELRDEEGFVGDRASGRAFRAILEDWRDKLRVQGDDPFGDTPTQDISKSKLDKVLAGDDPLAAGLVHSAVEEYAVELATVVRRFLRLKNWQDTERIVVGGGLSASHIGELAMGRAAVLLAGESVTVELRTITNNPDKAGLIGAVHLAPSWVLAGHDAVPGGGRRRHQSSGRRRRAQPQEGQPVEGGGVEISPLAASRRSADARAGARAHGGYGQRVDRLGCEGKVQAGALRRPLVVPV